jgi:hypothetical protein
LFAKRIVAHLKAQRAEAPLVLLPSSINPDLVASASAPPAEPSEDGPHGLIPSRIGLNSSTSNAPPDDLFDPPPKVPFSPEAPLSPSIWTRLFGHNQSSEQQRSHDLQASPSAPPVASSSSGSPHFPPMSAATSSSAPSSSDTLSTSLPLSKNVSLNPSTALLEEENPKKEKNGSKHLHQSVGSLSLSKVDPSTKKKRSPPIEMPPALLPPPKMVLNDCRPKFSTEEIYMPFIVPTTQVRLNWSKWLSTLWFTDTMYATFQGCTTVLCPAWRLQGELAVKYHAVATLRIQQKEKVVVERYKQSGTLRISDYVSVFAGLDKEVPFSDLMRLCVLTDQLPTSETPGFVQWMFGARPKQAKLHDFECPDGTLLDRSPDWYASWQDSVMDITNSSSVFVQRITAAIRSQEGLRSAEVKVDEIELIGFHTLHLAPIRIPMYLCNYIHPSQDTPFHFVMSGQNGEIHDGANRPFTRFGGFMKGLFSGAFTK